MKIRPAGHHGPGGLTKKLRAVMPSESTIDLDLHAQAIAKIIEAGRRRSELERSRRDPGA